MRKKNRFDSKLSGFRMGHEAKKGYGEPQSGHWTSRSAKRDCEPCRATGEVVIVIGHTEHRQECSKCRGFGWLEAV
jgi:DnaJ-class molecular chaperone